MNFPGRTNEEILEKLDDIIKEQPGDLIVHVGTNDLTNNVNLLTNVKKSLIKRQNEHSENLNRYECPFEKFFHTKRN